MDREPNHRFCKKLLISGKRINTVPVFGVSRNKTSLLVDSGQDSVVLAQAFSESHCQRKPGGAKRLGSADFLYFFSIQNQADKINFGDIKKISRRFTPEIDHPPSFWPREALKTTKTMAIFSGLKQFILKELVHSFFSEAKSPNNKRFGCLKSYL